MGLSACLGCLGATSDINVKIAGAAKNISMQRVNLLIFMYALQSYSYAMTLHIDIYLGSMIYITYICPEMNQ